MAPFEGLARQQHPERRDAHNVYASRLLIRRACSLRGGFVPPPRAGAQEASPPAIGLTYRILGKTGFKVTSVGCGCAFTPDPSVIERAADMGINYFDTARIYQHGNNERLVGTALKGKRRNIYLSSKTDGTTKQSALEELDTSLRELGTDYLDVWCLHAKDHPNDPRWMISSRRSRSPGSRARFVLPA